MVVQNKPTKPTHFLFFSSIHMLRHLFSIILASQFCSQLKLTEEEWKQCDISQGTLSRQSNQINKAAVPMLCAKISSYYDSASCRPQFSYNCGKQNVCPNWLILYPTYIKKMYAKEKCLKFAENL